MPPELNHAFFDRSPRIVARELLGCGIAKRVRNRWLGGLIVETEAYLSAEDPASHSDRGRRRGNASMFAAPGTLYVYPIHAKHCLNFVTEAEGVGSAVLIRAIEPVWGLETMRRNRNQLDPRRLTSGPGMICQAMGIDRRDDGTDLVTSEDWAAFSPGLESSVVVDADPILATPRIGISRAVELPLRFLIDGNRFVSGRAGDHSRPRKESLNTGGLDALRAVD